MVRNTFERRFCSSKAMFPSRVRTFSKMSITSSCIFSRSIPASLRIQSKSPSHSAALSNGAGSCFIILSIVLEEKSVIGEMSGGLGIPAAIFLNGSAPRTFSLMLGKPSKPSFFTPFSIKSVIGLRIILTADSMACRMSPTGKRTMSMHA